MAKKVEVEAQPYFRKEGLAFLRLLKRNNDRDWFHERKAVFEAEVKAPMLAIARKVTDAMLDFAPQHVKPAEKALFRIYRDTRFSNDKRPYKEHIGAWWSVAGAEKTSGAGYYFHVGSSEVVIAAGAYMPEKEELALIRGWLAEHYAEFNKLLKRKALTDAFNEFEGAALKRAPKGYAEDHPAIELLKNRQWGVAVTLPAETALDPEFAKEVIRRLKLAAPVVDALNAPLVARFEAERKERRRIRF